MYKRRKKNLVKLGYDSFEKLWVSPIRFEYISHAQDKLTILKNKNW